MKYTVELLIIFSLLITSCKNEEIEGCTDQEAYNYDSKADKNDGSCEYYGYITFYKYNSTRCGSSLGSNIVEVTINDEIKSISEDTDPAKSISCGDSYNANFKLIVGQKYNYSSSVEGGCDGQFGTVTVDQDLCTSILWQD